MPGGSWFANIEGSLGPNMGAYRQHRQVTTSLRLWIASIAI